MSTISSLYPVESYPNGNSYGIAIRIEVPGGEYNTTIERVDLIGNQIFILSKVEEDQKSDCCYTCGFEIDTKKVTVKIPQELDKSHIKVNAYVIGKTWNEEDLFRSEECSDDYSNIADMDYGVEGNDLIQINHENEYLAAFQNIKC